MTTPTYQQLIIDGIKGLPLDVLKEITDYVYFVRKKTLQPDTFAEEFEAALIAAELGQLSHGQETHLEQEFENYDTLYPYE